MYVCMYVCIKLGSLQGSARFASSSRYDWHKVDYIQPDLTCCLICFCLNCCPPHSPFFLFQLSEHEFKSSKLAFVAKCLLTKSSSSNIINITYRDMSREASPSRLIDVTKACSWEIIYVTDLIYLIAKPS